VGVGAIPLGTIQLGRIRIECHASRIRRAGNYATFHAFSTVVSPVHAALASRSCSLQLIDDLYDVGLQLKYSRSL